MKDVEVSIWECCGSGAFFSDPGDPKKTGSYLFYLEKTGSGSGIFTDPDPGDPKRQDPDPDPQHCYLGPKI